jgi:SAM-dependent methyltransferase
VKYILHTHDEWRTRTRALGEAMAGLVSQYATPGTGRGLDLGARGGALTDILLDETSLEWCAVEPAIESSQPSPSGRVVVEHGWAHQIPYPDDHFDCVVFANVYEHVLPEFRTASLVEIRRVLRPGGVLVGQLPNPYFPIEMHSRLPGMGWLPRWLQKKYWRLTPVVIKHDFFVVTVRQLRREAEKVGFSSVLIRNFNYPLDAIPEKVRWAVRLFERPMRIVPSFWHFVFSTPATASSREAHARYS